MKPNNNKSLLVGALICILGAMLSYTLEWANFYFMSSSLWQVADICANVDTYLGLEGYKLVSLCIKGGAVISLLFLLIDAYKISKPLLNGSNSLQDAKNAGAGSIVSILFTIAFIILVYSANDGELDGASITLWPVVSIAACITSKVMLTHLETEVSSMVKQYFEENKGATSQLFEDALDNTNVKTANNIASGEHSSRAETPTNLKSSFTSAHETNETWKADLEDALDYAETYDELIAVLDEGISHGLASLDEIKYKCIHIKQHYGSFDHDFICEAKRAILKQLRTI